MYKGLKGLLAHSSLMRWMSSEALIFTFLFSALTYTSKESASSSLSPMTITYEHQSCFAWRTFFPTVIDRSSTLTRIALAWIKSASSVARFDGCQKQLVALPVQDLPILADIQPFLLIPFVLRCLEVCKDIFR